MFNDLKNFKRNDEVKFTLVEEYPEIDYALVYLGKANPTPWVAAWCLNKEQSCWGQGHYFTELADAMEYIGKKLTEKTGRNEPKIEDDGYMERKGEGYEVQWYNDEGDNDRVVRCNNVQALAQYLSRCMWGDVETTNNPTIWYNGKPWCRYEYTGIDEESY